MPLHGIKPIALAALLMFAGVALVPAHAANSYCPNPAHQRPAKVPGHLRAAVARAFHVDAAAVRQGAFVRCAGKTAVACLVGANLVCGKADKRRSLPGATAWCRQNPNAKFIPMAATGHATIYNWSCEDGRAVAGKAIATVDRQGYIAQNWKAVR